MKQVRNFLRIRLLQIKRELAVLGWWRIILLLLASGMGGIYLYGEMNRRPACFYATGFIALIVYTIQTYRTDKKFVLITGLTPAKLYFIEYIFFSIPIFLIMAFTGHWYMIVALLSAYCLIALIRYTPGHKRRSFRSFPFIPSNNFEWISGVRKNLWLLSALYIFAVGLLHYKYASLIILWLLLAVIASFYQECEPWNIINLEEAPPERFIAQKLKLHFQSYLIFTAPVFIGYIIFHFSTVWIAVIIYVLSFIDLAMFIVSKYAIYEPGEKLSANNTLVTIIHLCILVPVVGQFLFPVPLFMAIRAYRKSLHKLKIYLDAYY